MSQKNESLDEINNEFTKIDFAVTLLKEHLVLDKYKVFDLYTRTNTNMDALLLKDVQIIKNATITRDTAINNLAKVDKIVAKVSQLKKNFGSNPESSSTRTHIEMIERDSKIIKSLRKNATSWFNVLLDDMRSYDEAFASSGMKCYLGSKNPVLRKSYKLRKTCYTARCVGEDLNIVANRIIKASNMIFGPSSETVVKKDTPATDSATISTQQPSEKS